MPEKSGKSVCKPWMNRGTKKLKVREEQSVARLEIEHVPIPGPKNAMLRTKSWIWLWRNCFVTNETDVLLINK